jgi:hypothetical protein
MQSKYQDEHALLVSFLARLLLVAIIAGQSLVYGGHGDCDCEDVVVVLSVSVAATEKVGEHLMPRPVARWACRTLARRARPAACMGCAFRHRRRPISSN